jgi:hypothetical protein
LRSMVVPESASKEASPQSTDAVIRRVDAVLHRCMTNAVRHSRSASSQPTRLTMAMLLLK